MKGVFKIFRRSYAQTAKTAKETKAPVKKLKQRHVRVTILGSDTDVGEATALLLKQNPLITQLHVYGEDSAATGADLRHLDTRFAFPLDNPPSTARNISDAKSSRTMAKTAYRRPCAPQT